jgi:hypothetical protein
MTPLNFYDDPTHVRPWTKHGLYCWLADYGGLDVVACGTKRNWPRVPLDLISAPVFLALGQVEKSLQAWKNVIGWSVFAIGKKPRTAQNTNRAFCAA